MKRFIVASIIFVFGIVESPAQERLYCHYDNSDLQVTDSTKATYSRTIESIAIGYIVREYYRGRKPKMVAKCSRYEPSLVFNGPKRTYFQSGVLESEGDYKRGKPVGIHKRYYQNGSPRIGIDCNGEMPRYQYCYDDQGNNLIGSGTGTVYEDTNIWGDLYTEVKDFRPVVSYRIRPALGDTLYVDPQIPASYVGGSEALSNDLKKLAKYPFDPKQLLSGTVVVSFVVTREGYVSEPKVVKGIGIEFDQIAMNALVKLGPWSPASHGGKAVKSALVMPISFQYSNKNSWLAPILFGALTGVL